MELLKLALGLIPLLKTSDEGQNRRNLRMMKKTRKKLYREFKKDGISEEEQAQLNKIDTAIIEALIGLGKF